MDQSEKYKREIVLMVNQLKNEDFLRMIYTILLRHIERGLN